jgi:hypothetical protein
METKPVRAFTDDIVKLNAIRQNFGFRNNAWVVHSLLAEKARNLASVEGIMNSTVPAVLTGLPLSGKSLFVKEKLLPSLVGTPVLVLDPLGEYDDLKNIGYDIFSLDFEAFNGHIRFVPNPYSKMAESEIENVFSHLDMKAKSLSRWVIVAEEAQSFRNISSFVKFLYSSRHHVRKMIAVTPMVDAFQGLLTFTVIR